MASSSLGSRVEWDIWDPRRRAASHYSTASGQGLTLHSGWQFGAFGPRPALPEGSPDSPRSRRHVLKPSRAFVWVMDAIWNLTATKARRGGRSVAPPDPLTRRRRRKSSMGSGRVPTEFPPPLTCRRQESESRGPDPAHPGTGRNSRGTEWELSRNRGPSGSSRMGTDWGVGRFTIEQTTAAVHSDPPLGRKRATEGEGFSPPATCSATERRSAGTAGATVRNEPDERSGRPRTRAPHDGGAIGGDGGRRERSDGERT